MTSMKTGRAPTGDVRNTETEMAARKHYEKALDLGNLLQGQKRFEKAEESYRHAILLRPDYAEAYNNLGVLLQGQKRFEEAEESYRRAILLRPDYAETYNNLGVLLREGKRLAEAEESYGRAILLRPDYAETHNNLGNLLREGKRFAEAEESYGRAISVRRDYAEAYNNLGLLLGEEKRFAEAEESYGRAISVRRDYAEAYSNLGLLLGEQKRLAEAEEACRRAIAIRPEYVEACNNLGVLLREQERFAEAEEAYGRAISINPNHAAAYYNLGDLFRVKGRYVEAEEAYGRAISLRPDYVEAHNNLGVLFRDRKRYAEAGAAYSRALEIRHDYNIARSNLVNVNRCMCRWEGLKNEIALLLAGSETDRDGSVNPCTMLTLHESSPMLEHKCAREYAERSCGSYLLRPPLHEAAAKAHGGRLRIGYVSSDFRCHPTSFLMVEAMELHDRGRFETTAYSIGPDDETPISKRIRGAFDRFEDIRELPFEEAARKIADDSIDILVDLNGYTRFVRTRIFALRPAPVQINWLGYPGTIGHERLADIIIGDPVVTPLSQAEYYSETLALMPHSYQPNDRQREIGPTPTREALGLPENGFVFCSFNANYKMTPEVFDIWCRLLEAVPGSVLWLLADSKEAMENLRREAATRGAAPERLVFAAGLSVAEHLGRLRQADLMLDTFPYTSHTTGSDALWVGLPLVTRIGETFASRVAASLLHSAGLPELVTTTFDDYFALALELATHPDKLASIREHLAAHRLTCPLFDSARFTRNLERLYERIWDDHLAGRKEPIVLVDEGEIRCELPYSSFL